MTRRALQRNKALLEQATTAGRGLGLPMLMVAGWNMASAQMASAAWLRRQRMRLIAPDGSKVSCVLGSGRGPRVGYHAASGGLQNLLAVCRYRSDVPWSPHLGMDVEMVASPLRVLTRACKHSAA